MIPELEAWRLEGLKRSARLAIEPDLINEAAGVVSSVFGDAWLAEACQRHPGALWVNEHPIGNLILPPGDNQVVELLELVEYLKFAALSPSLPDLVLGLRAQYGPTFLQLASAYRLSRIGASELAFEPPAQRGLKGDIAFNLSGKRLQAECYIPRVKLTNVEVDWLLQRCLAMREGKHAAIVSIAIKLKGALSAVQRKTALRIVRELCDDVDSTISTAPHSRFVETETAFISVAPTRAVGPNEDSIGMQDPRFPDTCGADPFVFARVMVGRATRIKPGYVPTPIESRDHVAIWLSDAENQARSLKQDLDVPLSELGRKLERKLSQARVDGETGRLLIVSSWIGRELGRASRDAIDRLRRLLFVKHSEVAGVLFLTHSYRRDIERPYYQVNALLPEDPVWMDPQHVEKLRIVEKGTPTPCIATRAV